MKEQKARYLAIYNLLHVTDCYIGNYYRKRDKEMTATIAELAKKLDLSPQTIRRYVNKNLDVHPEPRKTLYLTDEQASKVAHHFTQQQPIQPRRHEDNQDSGEEVQRLRQQIELLQAENTALKAAAEKTDSATAFYREEIERLHEALEREQNKNLGFFNRLGQKLLGVGKKENE